MAVKPSWESWAERKSLVLLNGQSVAPVSQVLSLLLSLLFKTKMESSSCSREKKKALTMMEKLGKLEIWINMIDKNEYNKLTYLANVIKDFLRWFDMFKIGDRSSVYFTVVFLSWTFPQQASCQRKVKRKLHWEKGRFTCQSATHEQWHITYVETEYVIRNQKLQWKVT